ncbi:MAG: Maf protein [Candidatus Saccharibacteria bacterium]|nr:Maf protein [Candidatus Saccharibacteria bacterium]
MKQLVLASASPAREELLSRAHASFIVDVSDYEEDMTLPLEPNELAIHLALGKGRSVASRHTNSIILSADSFAVFDKQLLGKPHTEARANQMLTMLSGQCHLFITGFAILDTDTGKEYSAAVETRVYFRELSSTEIDNYLAKENVLAKAGAYTVQGLGAAFVERIEGDYSNVVGLPLASATLALRDFGIELI